MIVMFIKEKHVEKIMEILKREDLKLRNVVHTEGHSSLCVTAELPFDFSDNELAAYVSRVLVKQGYREISHGTAEHLCSIYTPFGRPMFRYFTK